MTGQNSGTRMPHGITTTRDEEGNLIYIPRYIAQDSDLNFGQTVTHEDYNEKFNLNIKANDYQSYVLELLLNESNPDETFHIPYLDKIIKDNDESYIETMDDLQNQITSQDDRIITAEQKAEGAQDTINAVIAGTTKVGHAIKADKIEGVDTVGNYKYYGTDKVGASGFHPMPPAVYAESILHQPTSVDGIYFIPGLDSVQMAHLAPAVREHIQRELIAEYDELQGRPKINGHTLVGGNNTLAEIGAQPIGNYLTSVPSEYVQRTELDVFDTIASVNTKVGDETTARTNAINAISNAVDSNDTAVRNWVKGAYNRCGVNAAPSNPIKGDLWVTT